MESDSVIFSDNGLMSLSFSAFQDMKKTGELVDFKVTIQNRFFFAHRVVLAAGIPYLRTMFASSESEMSLDQIDPDVFENLIDFAYCGKIKISVGNVQPLLVAAQQLQLTTVHDACVKYMAMRINVNNVFSIRSFSGNIQSLSLAVACDHSILRNFEAFVSSQRNEFLQLPFPYLKEIVSRDDLNVTREEKVFEAIMFWIRASPAERYTFLPELLSAVRMTHIAPDYLVEKVASEEFVMSSLPCKHLVEETKNYHLLAKKRSSFDEMLTTRPRNTAGHGLYAICSSPLGSFVDMFDCDRETWITLSQISTMAWFTPFGRTVGVVGFKRKLYIFQNYEKKIEIFDAITLQREPLSISEGSCKPEELFEQIVLHDSKFYAFTTNKVLCFDPVLSRWQGVKAYISCEESGIASLGNYIYLTGGYIGHSVTNTSKRYNPITSNESRISPMLVARRCHGCAGLNNKLYVCGGKFCQQLETAEVFDPITNQWNFISPIKTTEREISLCAYKGRLYALGGSETEIYEPQHDIWKSGAPVPSSCKLDKCVTIPLQ